MDPLSDMLALLKPNGFAFRGLDGAGDWALRFGATDGIKAFSVEAGTCLLALEDDNGKPLRIGSGDLVLLPGRSAFRLFTSADVEPIDAYRFFPSFPAGTIGTINGGGECCGVGGFFSFEGSHSELLIAVLPPMILIRAEATRAALELLIARLMRELREPQLGGALIAAHLAQTLLVEAMRFHLNDRSAIDTGWLAALRDGQMRAALSAMHADPARAWTLADLARVTNMSRSSFAARFKDAVGEGALGYLTRWRMALAADRLAQGRSTLASIAPTVGYASEGALGIAFKRVLGQSPRQFLRSLNPTVG